jgi:hypothetical protein
VCGSRLSSRAATASTGNDVPLIERFTAMTTRRTSAGNQWRPSLDTFTTVAKRTCRKVISVKSPKRLCGNSWRSFGPVEIPHPVVLDRPCRRHGMARCGRGFRPGRGPHPTSVLQWLTGHTAVSHIASACCVGTRSVSLPRSLPLLHPPIVVFTTASGSIDAASAFSGSLCPSPRPLRTGEGE